MVPLRRFIAAAVVSAIFSAFIGALAFWGLRKDPWITVVTAGGLACSVALGITAHRSRRGLSPYRALVATDAAWLSMLTLTTATIGIAAGLQGSSTLILGLAILAMPSVFLGLAQRGRFRSTT
ncbi:MAG: hypothetical protein K4304_12455 [Propionicimonas sp.]